MVLAEAHFDLIKPFFGIPRLQHLAGSNPDVDRNNEPLHDDNVDIHYGHDSWEPHYIDPPNPDLSYDMHHEHRPFDPFNPFLHGNGGDPGFGMNPYDMDNFHRLHGAYPGFHNVFNIPGRDHHSHEHKPSDGANHQGKKPKQEHNVVMDVKNPDEKPTEVPTTNDKPTAQDKDPKLKDVTNPDIKNNLEDTPPKTNAVNKDDLPKDEGQKDDEQVGLKKKKDFLLVGSSSNGNNIYLLHENNPNTNAVAMPNPNQPGDSIVYVPYNPGPSNNQVYQIVSGQPASLPTNPLAQDKLNVNGYNNGITNNGQPTISTPANQSPNYVLVYSNGQVIKIPGVVLNTASNNVPLQNGNQGPQYIVSNTLPNNMQNMQGIQNPATNVMYTIPNQGSRGQIYVQMPSCIHSVPNYVCGSGAVVQNPGQGVNNAGNIMPNNGLPNNVVSYQPNQIMVAQPAVQIPNGASNVYAQPNMVPNQGQGPNVAVNIPSQGTTLNNPNVPFQPAVQMPVNSASNGYDQPIPPNQGQGSNGAINVPNPAPGLNNQNGQIQPAVALPVSGISNGYNQPQAPNQGDKGINAVPSHDTVANQPEVAEPVALTANAVPNENHVVLDSNNLDSLGAQPAVMISGFRETTGDKKDETNKDKKGKKDKSKKKDKKSKDSDKSKELTN